MKLNEFVAWLDCTVNCEHITCDECHTAYTEVALRDWGYEKLGRCPKSIIQEINFDALNDIVEKLKSLPPDIPIDVGDISVLLED